MKSIGSGGARFLSTLVFMLIVTTFGVAQETWRFRINQSLTKDGGYLEVKANLWAINQSSTMYLGNSDFVIEADGDALDLDGIIVDSTSIYDGDPARGGDSAAYYPQSITRGDGNQIVISVRRKMNNPTINDPIPNNVNSRSSRLFVLRIPIRDCMGYSRVIWVNSQVFATTPTVIQRRNGGGTIYDAANTAIAHTRLDYYINNTVLGSIQAPDLPMPLRNPVVKTNVICQTSFGNVSFFWRRNASDTLATKRYAVVLLDTFSEAPFQWVNVDTANSFKYQLQPGQRAMAFIVSYGSCAGDSLYSDTAGVRVECRALACPRIDSAVVTGTTVTCPGKPVFLRVTNPYIRGQISWNGGVSWTRRADTTITSIGGNFNTRDTSFVVLLRDSNLCVSAVSTTYRIEVNQLTNQGTVVQINDRPYYYGKQFCNNLRIPFSRVMPAGNDTLQYVWSSANGLGRFEDLAGNLDSTSQSVWYRPNLRDTGRIFFRVFDACFNRTDTVSASLVSGNDPDFSINSVNLVGNGTRRVVVGEEVEFTIDAYATNLGAAYRWNFGDGKESFEQTAKVTHTFLAPGVYKVQLFAKSGDCEFDSTFDVTVENIQQLFIPNVFSPGSTVSDNANLRIFGLGISNEDFEFTVYNRWGQLVYEAESFADANTKGWNGAMKNNGQVLPIGTYSYAIRGKFLDGTPFERTGNVTLVR